MVSTTEKINTRSGVEIVAEKRELDGHIEVSLRIKARTECLLHWGLSPRSRSQWQIPPRSLWPEGTRAFGETAVQTPFITHNNEGRIVIRLEYSSNFSVIAFVLFFPEEDRWDNNHGKNYYIYLAKPIKTSPEAPALSGLAEEVIGVEMSRNSWTLMHRFNLCHDLLERVGDNVEGLALLFVWLRFSALRQLDWQRNYNTQPRELSHAMDRLTLRLADIYTGEPASRALIRLMLTTLGRGGEGQRIRDEILEIMHRHHIKEVCGTFMEEWHQKMHNNTTPDDIIICEAYLEFLRTDGDRGVFYRTLEARGVTKERLESFDRPLKTPPDFVPHLKEGLIHDFEHFLKTLKSIHSGCDLESAINCARGSLDGEMHGLLDFVWQHRDDPHMPVEDVIEKVTEARLRLNELLKNARCVRDLLFLDLALEAFFRTLVERNIHKHLSGDQLVELISMALQSFCLSHDNDEIARCFLHWERLKGTPRFGQEWSLHAEAVLDRLGRALGSFTDHYHQLLQPKAELLGHAFHADSWTIDLFSEEVVRGSALFVLSILLRHIHPVLRETAHLGNWQVISRGRAMGRVQIVEILRSMQAKSFDDPTIIIAEKVIGNEEIPEGVTAVVTPDMTDIASHVAIRARNAQVLFATCYDPETIALLKSLKGRLLHITVDATGEVVFEEGTDEASATPSKIKPVRCEVPRPHFTVYAISSPDFVEGSVGGKSINQTRLLGQLPEWIDLPVSVALPFGVFEKVLTEGLNLEIARHYEGLLRQVDDKPNDVLVDLRKAILALEAPKELISSLRDVMEVAGLVWPRDWENAWMCIKRVWASKWNERAFLSRKAREICHEDLFMAVLIQEVIEAEYAFVIHTVNPITDNRDELYAEVVLGLGETLVGNYPGRALSFTCRKKAAEPHLLAYPGKSIGLYGSGLIFRSDSNGEDLAGYAGAGLYDSVMLNPPRQVRLDYAQEPIVWDEGFRREILVAIAKIGVLIENASGSPQDIEGVYARGQYRVVQTRPQVGIENG